MLGLLKKYLRGQSDKAKIQKRFENWLERISKEEKVNPSIIGFNFGLFESDKGYIMYLTGSTCFDKEDDDWATQEDFEPQNKYFEFGNEFSKGKSWVDILNYTESLIGNYIRSANFKDSILTNAMGITTGFDDGDLKIIYFRDEVNNREE